MRDKAIREICASLFPLAEEVYLTHPEHPRAATPEEILAALDSRPAKLHIEIEPARALEKACRASSPDDVVLVVGSLFLVGAIKKAQREGKLHLPELQRSRHASRFDAVMETAPPTAAPQLQQERSRPLPPELRAFPAVHQSPHLFLHGGLRNGFPARFPFRLSGQVATCLRQDVVVADPENQRNPRARGRAGARPSWWGHDLLRESPERHGYSRPVREPARAVSLRGQALVV